MVMFGVLMDEAKKAARDPRRLREAFRPRRWRQLFGILRFNGAGSRWKSATAAGLKQREYSSYEEYVRHQKSKFEHLDLSDYDRKYRGLLVARLRAGALLKPGASVLCLGARQGTEVKAFQDLGCFAIGIDLNPGGENKFVLPGDFHAVQFPDGCVDVVFTNSFDHTFDPEKLIGEIARLLKTDGLLIVEAIRGEAEESAPDYYASFWWQKIDDLIGLLDQHGFKVLRREPFGEPWPGEQIAFHAPQSRNAVALQT
jgi:SAM-dependent methyltransferase